MQSLFCIQMFNHKTNDSNGAAPENDANPVVINLRNHIKRKIPEIRERILRTKPAIASPFPVPFTDFALANPTMLKINPSMEKIRVNPRRNPIRERTKPAVAQPLDCWVGAEFTTICCAGVGG